MRSSFSSFLCEGEQRRLFFTLIIEQNFEKCFRTRLIAHLVNLSGVASGRIFATFLSATVSAVSCSRRKGTFKRSYRAEFKLTFSELFVERSKKIPSLKSASLSTRRFAACAYFFEVAWRSNLDNHSRDRARACKTHGCHCRPLEPGKYATEIRGPRHVQLDFSRTQTTAKLNWPRTAARNGGCDRCGRPLVVLAAVLIGQRL